MIDIHTHVLPCIDDGSDGVESSMKMLMEAQKAGFTDIIATSHYIDGQYETNTSERKAIIDAIQNKLNEEIIDIKLHNGAEIYIVDNLTELIENRLAPTLADSKYVLFEIPMNSKVLYLNRVIEELISMRYVPIIAHPERYSIVQDNPNEAINWVKNGVMLQANYGSIIGKYGRKCEKTLIKLLKANAVHFLGTDTHRPETIYTNMDEILEKFEKEVGRKELNKLTTYNPEKVLLNERIYIPEPDVIKVFWK